MWFACVICKDRISASTLAATIDCGHMFHKDCIALWCLKKRSCPQCRVQLGKQPTEVQFVFESEMDSERSDIHFSELTQDIEKKKAELGELRRRFDELDFNIDSEMVNYLQWESEIKTHRAEMALLKKKYHSLKSERKMKEKLRVENTFLNDRVELLTRLNTIINGDEGDVHVALQGFDISLKTVQQLCLIIVALKSKLKHVASHSFRKQERIRSMIGRVSNQLTTLEGKKEVSVCNKSVQTDDVPSHNGCASHGHISYFSFSDNG